LLITIPMLFIVSVLTFVILRMLPSDPVAMIVGINRTPERVEYVTAQLGLDKPLVEQFVIWMGNVLQGDLGTAWHTGQAVTTDLAARIPASVELAFLALLIGVPGGVATGVIAARYRDRFADFGLRFSSLLAIATPEFLFGIFAIWLFFAVLNWAPAPLGRIEFGISPPEAITGLYIVDHLFFALAIAINCKSRLEAETICVAWEKSNATFERVADEQLGGVPAAMRENPATLGREGAAALQDALYRRVTVRTEEQCTVVETETKGGLTRRITMAPDEIDREFAVNGLDEHFHHNVMGGERLREAARQAVTAARRHELCWETGQTVPTLQTADLPHRGPDLLR